MFTASVAREQDGDGIVFIASEDDIKGSSAVKMLMSLGYKARIFKHFHPPTSPFVAVFGINTNDRSDFGGHGRYLRCASYRLDGKAPGWAKQTPLKIGVFQVNTEALKEAAQAFSKWKPGAIGDWVVPWARTGSPFKPDFAYLENKNITDRRDLLREWRMKAFTVLGKATAADILNIRLPSPIFSNAVLPSRPEVLLMGCAVFNKPHTDVASVLLSDKMTKVQKFITQLVNDLTPHVSQIRFPLVNGDFMSHVMLRKSLHPFMFRSIASIERALNESLPRTGIRHKNRNGKRTYDEIAEALDAGAALVVEELIEPVNRQTELPILPISWTQIFSTELLNSAWQMARANKQIVEEIYFERVEAHAWWKDLDQFDRSLGLQRCYANVGIYLATAWYLMDHPNTIVVDAEVDFHYWQKLQRLITEKFWKGNNHLIFPAPSGIHQPWAY